MAAVQAAPSTAAAAGEPASQKDAEETEPLPRLLLLVFGKHPVASFQASAAHGGGLLCSPLLLCRR